MADQLCTPADLAAFLQADLDTATATLLIECATAVVQAAAGGQRIIQVSDDIVVLSGGTDAYLDLPQIPVTAVGAVTVDGSSIAGGTTGGTYRLRGNRIWRDIGWYTTFGEPAALSITYTHGYAAGAQELQLGRQAVLSLCAAVYTNPGGATREQIDDYAVAYDAMATRMEATPSLKAALRRQYGRRAGLVRIG